MPKICQTQVLVILYKKGNEDLCNAEKHEK